MRVLQKIATKENCQEGVKATKGQSKATCPRTCIEACYNGTKIARLTTLTSA